MVDEMRKIVASVLSRAKKADSVTYRKVRVHVCSRSKQHGLVKFHVTKVGNFELNENSNLNSSSDWLIGYNVTLFLVHADSAKFHILRCQKGIISASEFLSKAIRFQNS